MTSIPNSKIYLDTAELLLLTQAYNACAVRDPLRRIRTAMLSLPAHRQRKITGYMQANQLFDKMGINPSKAALQNQQLAPVTQFTPAAVPTPVSPVQSSAAPRQITLQSAYVGLVPGVYLLTVV